MLKKLFSSITLVVLVGMLVGGLANAATSTVTATVTVKYASLSLDHTSFAYGSMDNNTASSTVTLWSGAGITATNGGSASDLDIYSTATSTGSSGGWTLSAANNTGNNYIHRFCKDTDVDCTSPPTGYTGNELTTSPQTLKDGVAESGTYVFQLQITTPTTPTDFTQQSVVVTVQASAT